MRAAPWRLVAWPISWPSTVARPASFSQTGRIPVYTTISPPGRQNALTSWLRTTLTRHWYWILLFSIAAEANRRTTPATLS